MRKLLNPVQMATAGGMMHAGAYQLPLHGQSLRQAPSLRMPPQSLQTSTLAGAARPARSSVSRLLRREQVHQSHANLDDGLCIAQPNP